MCVPCHGSNPPNDRSLRTSRGDAPLQHFWVVISLTLTLAATVVLILHMRDVTVLAAQAQVAGTDDLRALGGDLPHAVSGLLVLMGVLVLNVYKPAGLTRHGWRLRQWALDATGPRTSRNCG